MRTLRLNGEVADLKLRELDGTLDLALPICLNRYQVRGVRELYRAATGV